MHLFVNANYPFMKWRKYGYIFSFTTLGDRDDRPRNQGGAEVERRLHGRDARPGPRRAGRVGRRPARRARPVGLGSAEIQRFGESNDFLIRVDRDEVRGADGEQGRSRGSEPGSPDRRSRCGARKTSAPRSGPNSNGAPRRRWRSGSWRSSSTSACATSSGSRRRACIALFHDVLFVIGAMTILNREFSLNVVAALLTIAGFSINDTIIVFDRIRENDADLAPRELLRRRGPERSTRRCPARSSRPA